ncbi:MAG: stage II sporulation protein R, partial [Eubacteriales bacterium]|nr:stage II sporulation protein R [Eubacteriales bacterium]
MKKFLIAGLVIAALMATIIIALGAQPAQADTDYLRIHVRANSNEQIDQNVKYKVKDEVVRYIT